MQSEQPIINAKKIYRAELIIPLFALLLRVDFTCCHVLLAFELRKITVETCYIARYSIFNTFSICKLLNLFDYIETLVNHCKFYSYN